MAKRELLLGDEALALGALHAGLSGVYAYPGTPSTEITEYIQQHPLAAQRNVHRTWSSNEKTAMEEALGMSFAGKRALVCMKHVGLNVAADAFVNSAMTGANGGLVVVAADAPPPSQDPPGPLCSQFFFHRHRDFQIDVLFLVQPADGSGVGTAVSRIDDPDGIPNCRCAACLGCFRRQSKADGKSRQYEQQRKHGAERLSSQNQKQFPHPGNNLCPAARPYVPFIIQDIEQKEKPRFPFFSRRIG